MIKKRQKTWLAAPFLRRISPAIRTTIGLLDPCWRYDQCAPTPSDWLPGQGLLLLLQLAPLSFAVGNTRWRNLRLFSAARAFAQAPCRIHPQTPESRGPIARHRCGGRPMRYTGYRERTIAPER